jgi:t-SNARE complex subunit (syntaxin)
MTKLALQEQLAECQQELKELEAKVTDALDILNDAYEVRATRSELADAIEEALEALDPEFPEDEIIHPRRLNGQTQVASDGVEDLDNETEAQS